MSIAPNPLNSSPHSPLPNPDDQAEVVAIVRDLLRRASVVPELTLSGDELDRWPTALFAELIRLGWLREARASHGLTCEVCPERCWIVPHERKRQDGTRYLWHLCGQHEDTGVLNFSVDRLRRWQLAADGIARWLSDQLGPGSGDLMDLGSGILRIGHAGNGRDKREILFSLSAPVHLDGQIAASDSGPHRPIWLLSARPAWLAPGDSRALVLGELLRWGEELQFSTLARQRLTGAEPPSTLRPVELPAGTTWEKIIVRVLDDETVEIQSGRRRERRTFVELGMADGRRSPPEPSLSWAFLLTLAREDGTLTWEDKAASDNARNHIRLLREALRQAFCLEGDPFHRYERKLGWRTRFLLVDEREG